MYFRSCFLCNCWLFVLLCKAKALDISAMKRLSSPVQNNCIKTLDDFAEAVSNYTYCAIQSSRPFRFCCKCKNFYTSALDGHGAIMKCSKELSAGEKYQIVQSTNSFVVKLWQRSNCPRCFNDKEGSPTDIKDEVGIFFQKMNKVEHCFYNYSQIHIIPIPMMNTTNHTVSNASSINPVCAPCKAVYDDLRDSYQKIIDTADSQESKVCADVSAAMTFVRQRWSDDFHCQTIYKDLVSVVALTCFFCFLPIIFYLSVKLNGDAETKKKRVSLRVNYAGSHSADSKS